jgi:hypothetical protein
MHSLGRSGSVRPFPCEFIFFAVESQCDWCCERRVAARWHLTAVVSHLRRAAVACCSLRCFVLYVTRGMAALVISRCDTDNGCLTVVPRSHRQKIHYAHFKSDDPSLVLNQARSFACSRMFDCLLASTGRSKARRGLCSPRGVHAWIRRIRPAGFNIARCILKAPFLCCMSSVLQVA